MAQQGLAVHETLEVHELLTFKNTCMTKSVAMQGLVSDPALKSLLQEDIQHSAKAIQDYQGLLSRPHI
ncbi:spore coat protein [Paenibacillus larvae]|jgi:similar to spore coat protein|uniref:Spore coat-like protein n=4 Tax=Paenibacillus larvae TaxID=1464 RepID=V9W4Q5_9BACL|nr:spore coat-like protein [Paenibacillus larvae]AHD04919.1 spore coat-like protein [Paenibacillus larvae subsp. larvae DSM 25430]AQR78060.1 spore coat protein [Paenibacillus larvae subsp. larvae]AQT85906.1 spore coat protein [Paenibacillus larvae subsp. pulvifaciens]AQZ45857.1 spore coat protein [Paenibacillus larvae subsp. pulvifaciens]ARF69225.1 spore coat protein [Paenibacillus larvae subsp. pulvifaciens]